MLRKKLGALVLSATVAATAVPAVGMTAFAADTDSDVYVLMNIPYADLYEADIDNNEVEIDAFTSATKSKTKMYSLVAGSYHKTSEGDSIDGSIFAVKLGDGITLEDVEALGGTEITDESILALEVSNHGETTTTEYTGADALFEAPSYSYYVIDADSAYYKETNAYPVPCYVQGAALVDSVRAGNGRRHGKRSHL